MFLFVSALLWLAQQQGPAAPELSAEQQQVTNLIGHIRRLAASEPVVYGVDTRLRAAEFLTARYPSVAAELLRDGQASLSGVIVPAERDRLRVRLARGWAPIDLNEAERIIGSMSRGADRDYAAEAYDQLYLFLRPHPAEARRIISRGLQAGAFRMASTSRLLEEDKTKDHEAASALFSEVLAAFPAESPSSEDVTYLLDQTKHIVGFNRALTVGAIDKALSATTSENLQQQPEAMREKLFREIASLLASIDPSLLKRYKDQWKDLDLPVLVVKELPRQQEKKGDNPPDISGLSYSEALTLVRGIESVPYRIEKLIDLSRRQDLTPQQGATVASEALSEAGRLPLGDDRLAALAMLSRDFARRNEPANAGLAAHMLSESFGKVCECEGATCRRDGQEFDCLQNVQDFAEYLDEFKVSPDSMGLDNISLEARLLVLKLKALLTVN
jgi:hypothetical protein